MKILSPVGNFESLKVAVSSGADEVYLGINEFNARNNIDGFSLASLNEAVDYAHVFGVKVNLAINILFKDCELQDAVNTIVEAYNMGVDSFIVQDLGLAYLISKNYPQIELHASTQMGLHNLEGVEALKDFGFKRVVLSRETSLQEIQRIRKNTNIEIEYFAQGALCVSFSGNCYLSSRLFDASGNRGRCKQLCRLPFTLTKNGKSIKTGYLLSAKDFMMVDRLQDLKNAGVDVLKIEGRARRPYYVGISTLEYRKALNGDMVDKDNLKLGFNRDYTEGYFNGNAGIISDYNNHIGINIGKVLKVNSGKKFNEVVISASRALTEKSTFKFFDGRTERCVLTAYDLKEISKGKYLLTTTQKVRVGDNVNLIIDEKSERELLEKKIKREIDICLIAKIGEPIRATATIDGSQIDVEGCALQPASSQPLTKEEVVANFAKHDLFVGNIEFGEFDRVFIPKKELNEFRRRVYDAVFNRLTEVKREKLEKLSLKIKKRDCAFKDFQIVKSIEEKRVNKNIIYSPEFYDFDDIKRAMQKVADEEKNFYLDLPNFATAEDIKLLRSIVEFLKVPVVVNNYYGLTLNTKKVAGAGLNVYNSVSAEVLNLPVISAEGEVGGLIDYPYMTLRHCPFKEHLNATCDDCPYDKGFELVMENGKRMKITRKKLSSCTFYLN